MLYEFDGYIYTNEFDPAFPGYKKRGKYVPLHNYVYWLNTGLIPTKGKTAIHHKDEDRKNNDFSNLELITTSKHIKIHKPLHTFQTKKSRSKISKNNNKIGLFGFNGAEFTNPNWRSRIAFNGRKKSLGSFIDPLTCEIIYKFTQNEIFKEL